ncbi:bridging integrator 2-like [Hydractinia symbiolongicarpus]|uniref:bridging integrator 2-like n=1 Tax=Hydractinia symbiolongicarpus TaxID=13093 RepID=UPI00254EE0DE|nr:bridging integrator 2-like [Hydractinia symbiolongicarpus]
MAEKNEKHGKEKGVLARTATYTSKKARRTTAKLKQRVGKGDETKDEVFDEFVLNFNKQQAAATRLYTELRNYLRCITAMQLAASNFGEAVKDVYEDEWSGKESLIQYFKDAESNWKCLSSRVAEEILEPLNSYQKPFADVKHKIHKRARKLVDYDHSRHAVDTLRAKGATKSSDAKKLNQAEEEYQKAKDVFIELTSELYEELPALYDSRIGFYVSCFQSIFTLEEVFHRDASVIRHSLNDLMDQLITDFSAGTYSTRKPFSAGLETTGTTSEKEDTDTKLSSGSLAQFYDVAVPGNDPNVSVDSVDSPRNEQAAENSTGESSTSENATDENSMAENTVTVNQVPRYTTAESEAEKDNINNEKKDEPQIEVPHQPVRPAPRPPPPAHLAQAATLPVNSTQNSVPPSRPKPPLIKKTEERESGSQNNENIVSSTVINSDNNTEPHLETSEEQYEAKETKFKPTVPPPPPVASVSAEVPPADELTQVKESEATTMEGVTSNVIAYKNNLSPTNPNKNNLIVPTSLYQVIATHKYTPEDEDELSFEKGEIIHVIPFDDPEDQDEGWLQGVMDSTGFVGVFPENFSKRL